MIRDNPGLQERTNLQDMFERYMHGVLDLNFEKHAYTSETTEDVWQMVLTVYEFGRGV